MRRIAFLTLLRFPFACPSFSSVLSGKRQLVILMLRVSNHFLFVCYIDKFYEIDTVPLRVHKSCLYERWKGIDVCRHRDSAFEINGSANKDRSLIY